MGYIEGEDRYQITLFPESIDEYVKLDFETLKLKIL